MQLTPQPSEFLTQYVTERLRPLEQGAFELPSDPPSFATDTRYVPLRNIVT